MKKIKILLLLFVMMIIGIGGVKGVQDVQDCGSKSPDEPGICLEAGTKKPYYINRNAVIGGGYVFSPRFSTKPIYSNEYINWRDAQYDWDTGAKVPNINICGSDNNNNIYKSNGCNSNYTVDQKVLSVSSYNYNYFMNNYVKENKNKIYAIYPNVGYYNDSVIDMKITLIGVQKNGADAFSFRFSEGSIGIVAWSTKYKGKSLLNCKSGPDDYSCDPQLAHLLFRVDYFKHCNEYDSSCKYEKIEHMKSLLDFTDLDYGEKLSFVDKNVNSFYFINLRDITKDFGFDYSYLNDVNHLELSKEDNRYFINPTQNFVADCTYDVENRWIKSNYKKETFEKREVYCGDRGELKTDKYSSYGAYYMIYPTGGDAAKIKSKDEKEKLIELLKRGGEATVAFDDSSFEFGWSGNYTSLEDLPSNPIEDNIPSKNVYRILENKDEMNIHNKTLLKNETYTDFGKYDLKYTIWQDVPLANKDFHYSKWSIIDTLPGDIDYNNLTSSSIKIFDNKNIDRTSWFEISLNEVNDSKHILEVSATKSTLGDVNFYGNGYKIIIPFKLKSSISVTSPKTIKNRAVHVFKFENDKQDREKSSNEVKFTLAEKKVTCPLELDAYKNAYNTNPNSVENPFNFLNSLYDKYSTSSKKLNKLFNYSIDNNGKFDLSNTACEEIKCTSTGEADGLFSCNSKNKFLNSSTPERYGINPRVCYMGDSNLYEGSYYDVSSNSYCSISMSYQLKVKNDEVIKKSQLLWQNLDNSSSLGFLDFDLKCEKLYEGYTSSNIESKAKINVIKIFKKVRPLINYSWAKESDDLYFDVYNYMGNFLFDEDLSLNNGGSEIYGDPSYSCSDDPLNPFCYTTFTGHFEIPIKYSHNRHLCVSSNGDFLDYSTGNKDFNCGWGLNISPNLELSSSELQSSGHYKKSVDFNISVPALSKNEYKASCNYYIETGLIPDCPDGSCDDGFGDLNAKFRVISVSNDGISSFPGLNGDGRFTGNNWCSNFAIGSIRFDDSNKSYIVGDLDGSKSLNDLDKDTFNSLNTATFLSNYKNNLAADADWDGVVTGPSDNKCDEYYNNDYCIFKNYFNDISLDNYCLPDNTNVNRYIVNSKSSMSADSPMYSFTLDPGDIKLIRDYNKYNNYLDFNLSCKNGNNCLDGFLTNIFKGIININGSDKSIDIISDNQDTSCFDMRHNSGTWCNNN